MQSRDNAPKGLVVMGSTGSIGTQTLDIVRRYPERFRVLALSACSSWELLAEQAREFRPGMVVIAEESHASSLRKALEGEDIAVKCGVDALLEAATIPEADIVVGALVGFSGLPSVMAALEASKTVALANKETLVVAGQLIMATARRCGGRILPVDSEHSAIFQCLWGENRKDVRRIVLTASGGPFRTTPASELRKVTPAQALRHPNWSMGVKVTIDSATMMNKGFEMIEARWLFDVEPDEIDVVVHPESVVHSMVEFTDGSVKAQLGVPDMRIPISVALAYPERLDLLSTLQGLNPLNLCEYGRLTFEKPDLERFPMLALAYEAARIGGFAPALMNAANEVAVRAFIDGKIGFCDFHPLVAGTMKLGLPDFENRTLDLDSIAHAHARGTKLAQSLIKDGLESASDSEADNN